MIIDKLYLKKFGKFENKEISLSPSLNIFAGENETGKSTIATALKSFFYADLTGKGKYKKNYIPIEEDKGLFDVSYSLDNGKKLKSLVTLGKTNAKTLIKTIDEETGDSLSIEPTKLGEHFFNISEEMFDSVCYIKDLGSISNITENKDDVHSSLSKNNNIVDIDLSEIIKKVKDELTLLQRKTLTGRIYPLEERKNEITALLNELDMIKASLNGSDNELVSLNEEEKEIKIKLSDIFKKYEYLDKYNEYEIAKEQLKLKEEIDTINKELSDIDLSFIKIPDSDFEKLKNASKLSLEKKPLLPLLSGIGVCVISFILSFISIYFSGLILASIPLFITAYKYNLINKEINKMKNEYSFLTKKYNIDSIDSYNLQKEEYLKNENKKNLLIQKRNFLSLSLTDFNKEYIGIYLDKPTYKKIELELLKEKYEKRLTEIEIDKNSIIIKRKNAFNNMPDYDTLNEEKKELEARIIKLKEEENIVKDALSIFNITSESFKASYIPYLNKEVKAILNELLDTSIDYFNINDNLTCEIRKDNSSFIIPKDYFSNGTNALIYFALRLAIYKLIINDEKIPLILDDSFLELDDKRFEKVFSYLIKNVDSQIIYFTSHERIFNLPLAKEYINRL